MQKLLSFAFLFILFLTSCENPFGNMGSSSSDCENIHSIGLSLEPKSEAILVNYSFINLHFSPIDPPPPVEMSCEPETVEISISNDGIDFENVVIFNEFSGSYLIENLKDCEFVTVKIEGKHPELNSISITRTALVGEVLLPDLSDNPIYMRDFNLSPDGNQFINQGSSNDWFLSSFSDLSQGQQIFTDVFRTDWNPIESNKVAGVENILVPIQENLNGWASKYLVEYDLNTGEKEILHEIANNMDFNNNDFKPENYWIHEFHYSLDAQSIYFISNKDNGATSILEQKVFDNIWKLNLQTKEIEAITDFLALNFELVDFVEDPKQKGNFYISGGERDVEVETDGEINLIDRKDIYYYNSLNHSISPVLVSDDFIEYLSISPDGENLVFTTKNSGKYELRNLQLSTQKQKQITYSDKYRPLKNWYHLNWISSTEFITLVNQSGEFNFATFSL